MSSEKRISRGKEEKLGVQRYRTTEITIRGVCRANRPIRKCKGKCVTATERAITTCPEMVFSIDEVQLRYW